MKDKDPSRFCNIETPLKSQDLNNFSKEPKQFLCIQDVNTLHEVDDELIENLKEFQKANGEYIDEIGSRDVKKQVEFSYIDFKWLRIGEKLKHMDEDNPEHTPHFDDNYFAELILKQEENPTFFGNSSVQKIIDFQFEKKTKSVMRAIFHFYLVFYVAPYIVTLITDNRLVAFQVFKICLLPQFLLLTIEFVQIYENRWDYFNDPWNWIDLTQIILFLSLFMIRMAEVKKDCDFEIAQVMKLMLVMFTFFKTLHFVVVYERLGFFIDMLLTCLWQLRYFAISYTVFGLMFAVIYQVIGCETDDELAPAHGLGNFGRLFLLVWRQGVGKLGLAAYPDLMLQPPSVLRYVNLYLIWIMYFIQVLFQLVFGLNFIIAMLERLFREINKQKAEYVYLRKAQLNQECYQLLKHVTKLEPYRILCFSYHNKNETDAIKLHGQQDDFE